MFFHSVKGIIALDIDGTLTAEAHALDPQVIELLNALFNEHWAFIFITGRPFQWGFNTLKSLSFPHALAVQNGALLLEMPSKSVLSRKYLSMEILPPLEKICKQQETDFVIYSGLENQECCYYRPSQLPSDVLTYVLERSAYLGEKWLPLQSFLQLPVTDFCSIKCFSNEQQAHALSRIIESELGLHAPPIQDPYNSNYFITLGTHAQATKGEVLSQFVSLTGSTGPIIAAGNDYNDLTMLKMADYKIVMADAPEELLIIADVIAPPATEVGIIQGLKEAIHHSIHRNGGHRG